MARYIEQGKSIFIPFHKGVSITDSQLHLRMYKTEEMFKRHFPRLTKYDVLCEYAPVVRCKDCKHYSKDGIWCDMNSKDRNEWFNWYEDDLCSYGERREGE